MNRLALMVALLWMSYSWATQESFGGIGVTIQSVPEGVRIVEVVPGGAASSANLQAGDVIVSVEGQSLAGKTTQEATALLRGPAGEEVSFEVLSESQKEPLQVSITRINLFLQSVDAQALNTWFGSNAQLREMDVQLYAQMQASQDQALLGVMQNGKLVSNEQGIQSKGLISVYTSQALSEHSPKTQTFTPQVLLNSFSRETIGFSTTESGPVQIELLDINGNRLKTWNLDNTQAGANLLSWNGARFTSGSYMLHFRRNTGTSAWKATLK